MEMSVSYQIVIEKHNSKPERFSNPGEEIEFIIQIPLRQVDQVI